MKNTRNLFTYAGPLALLSLSQVALAQTAPAAPAAPKPPAAAPAAPKAPAAQPPAAAKAPGAAPSPAAPAPAAAPTPAPAAPPAPAAAPAAPPAPAAAAAKPAETPVAPTTATAPAANAPAPVVLDATVPLMQPAPAVLPPPAPPAFEPAPVPPPAPAAELREALPTKFAIGKSGWLQIGLLAQTWLIVENGESLTSRVDYPSGRTWDTTGSVRFRRAQIKLHGDIVKDTVGFLVLFDMAKTMSFAEVRTNINGTTTTTGYRNPGDTSALLDFMITYKSSIADVSIGQWKVPISYEGTTSSAELLLPERSVVSRYFGDYYDQGIRVDKKFEYVKYSLQVLDGVTGSVARGSTGLGTTVTGLARTNQLDNNRQKDLALRLEFMPMKGIMVGGAALASIGQRSHQHSTHDILEADAQIDMHGFLARAEFLWGWQGKTGDGFTRTKSRGMVGSLGYTIANTIQPVARIGYLDVDGTAVQGDPSTLALVDKFGGWYKTDEIRSYELGLNYLIDGKAAKIQAAYAYFDLDDISSRHQAILSGQVSF